jgi:hypothetical protein
MKNPIRPGVGEGEGVGTLSVGVASAVGVRVGVTAVVAAGKGDALWLGANPPRSRDRITRRLANENKSLALVGISVFWWWLNFSVPIRISPADYISTRCNHKIKLSDCGRIISNISESTLTGSLCQKLFD